MKNKFICNYNFFLSKVIMMELVIVLVAIVVFLMLALFLVRREHQPNRPHPPHRRYHIIGGCSGTRWGCCENGFTPKDNRRGTNCPKL